MRKRGPVKKKTTVQIPFVKPSEVKKIEKRLKKLGYID